MLLQRTSVVAEVRAMMLLKGSKSFFNNRSNASKAWTPQKKQAKLTTLSTSHMLKEAKEKYDDPSEISHTWAPYLSISLIYQWYTVTSKEIFLNNSPGCLLDTPAFPTNQTWKPTLLVCCQGTLSPTSCLVPGNLQATCKPLVESQLPSCMSTVPLGPGLWKRGGFTAECSHTRNH